MSKMSKVAGRAGVVAVAVAAVGSIAAGNASAGPLPNGTKVVPTPAGWSIVLKSVGNSYSIRPSMATPQSREAWVSSSGSVEVKAPAGEELDGKLGVGLIVGCQFPGQIGGGIDVTGPSAGLDATRPSVGIGGVGANISVPLSPGATDSNVGFGREDQIGSIDSITFDKAGKYNVAIKDNSVSIEHCSGYAQARVVTWVSIKGSNRLQGFLYGKPFSLG